MFPRGGAVGVLQRLLELAEANVREGTVAVETSRRGASGVQLDRLRVEPHRRRKVPAQEGLAGRAVVAARLASFC